MAGQSQAAETLKEDQAAKVAVAAEVPMCSGVEVDGPSHESI